MEHRLKTKFTDTFNVPHPIISAPMNLVSGGKLAAAVSKAGGLGLIGGGYGDGKWLENAFSEAEDIPVGIGVITWSILRQPHLIEWIIARKPAAILVSFGNAEDIIKQAQAANIPTMWQVQTLEQAKQAIRAGTDVIIAQGQEAGGHAKDRGLFSLLPAIRDLAGADQIIMAAGGIADGRGLAAALTLGADGILMGTRFYASREADTPKSAHDLLIKNGGDDTLRSSIFDIARGLDWPDTWTGRVIENEFSDQWKGQINNLIQNAEAEQQRYNNADPEDYTIKPVIAGEVLDLITEIKSAEEIIESTVSEAVKILQQTPSHIVIKEQ